MLTPAGRGLICSTVTLGRGGNAEAAGCAQTARINSPRAAWSAPDALPGAVGVASALAMAAGHAARSQSTTAAPQAGLPKFSALVSAKARNRRARSGVGDSSNATAAQRARCS